MDPLDNEEEECHCNKRGIDYYGVLSLKKNSNDLEIKAAFRRLAIRYNPARHENEGTEAIFALVAEAYDVLSDPLKRTIYDQFGEEGLKNGVPGAEGFIEPYIYHGEPMRTYREFFGTESPYADLLHILTQPSALLEFPEGRGIKRKEEPLIKTLYLTLTEVFFGGIKKMKIQRMILAGDDKSTTVSKEKILTIPIKPGLPTGTRIIFPAEGDQGPTKIPGLSVQLRNTFLKKGKSLRAFLHKGNRIESPQHPNANLHALFRLVESDRQCKIDCTKDAYIKCIVHLATDRNGLIVVARIMSLLSPWHVSAADVIFITEDRPHETFRREGSDLHMTVDIFLREALTGTVVTVDTVDDRTLRIPITSVVRPDYQKHVMGEGLPLPENPKEKGDLIINFNIEFPVYLPVSSKNYVKRVFDVFDTSGNIEDTAYIHRLILANKMRRNVDIDIPLRRESNDEAKQLEYICNT